MKIASQVQLLFVFFLLGIANLLGQTQWDKYANNPVLTPGAPGSWDETFAIATTVFYHQGIYKMWYEGDGGFGYATSPDGFVWTKDAANPLLTPGPPGSWDAQAVNHASVLFVNGTYHMWYSGVDFNDINRIGHATSPDGITWTKDPANPVLIPGGNWDDFEAIHPTVIYEDSTFRMYYNGHDGLTQRVVYAYSTDGTNWIKHTAFFMLEHGLPGSWDENELGPLSVLHPDSAYHMWYTGWDNNDNFRIGHATSPDGFTWTKDSANPVLGPGNAGEWDAAMIAIPAVLFRDNLFKMWYGGFDGSHFQTGYATSNDTATTSISNSFDQDLLPSEYELSQNYPNPFNPETHIEFRMANGGFVELRIYDLLGKEVKTLVNERRQAGTYTEQWDGTNTAGQPVASGVYLYQLRIEGIDNTRNIAPLWGKMLLLR